MSAGGCGAMLGPMRTLVRSFFKGLLIVVPLAVTIYVIYFSVTLLDGVFRGPFPGFGVLVVLVAITLIGLLASNVIGKTVVDLLERGISTMPVVKLVYGSIKDLMGAFVGDEKSFDKPVMVELGDGLKVPGFVTCTSFDDPKLYNHVAVYLPQSYNFAGNVFVVHRDRVQSIDADGAQFMAFIISGGVSDMSAARTIIDGHLPEA